MAFIKRLWKDRISEFPNRRTINDGNVTKQVTVGRDEGAITEEGDSFDASNMNDLEQRIEDAYGDLQGLVASEVAQQYDSSNVIFDAEPTEGHGTGYTVTSEGIKTAIDSGLVHTKTASGSLVHITDGADNIPVKALVSQIVAVESGNGQPKSPTNPYIISGFDNAVITRCGKNLFNFSPTVVTSSRTIASDIFLKAGTYVCSFFVKNTTAISGFFQVRIGTTSIGGVNFPENYQGIVNKAFILSKDSIVNIFVGGASAGYNFEFSNGQIEISTTPTNYEAYNGNNYTFTFGQTVYGGHFDNKGNLVITLGAIDLGSLTWGDVDGNGLHTSSVISDMITTGYASDLSKFLCEIFTPKDQYVGWAGMTEGQFGINAGTLRIKWSSIASGTDFKTFVNGKYLVYELATPITLSITSQDIPTLLGENNIFSNCGDCEVTYYVDTDAIYAIRDVIDEFAMQSDWNEADNTKADYIKNKPTIPANADFSLSGLSDTDISSASAGQVLTFDGDNWVNSNIALPSVKYEEINVTFDASGEGTLFNSVKFVVGLKDIPSDQLYVGYVSYIAGSTIKIKALSRTAIAFSSQNNVSSTRKVGVYYLDNIATQ